VAILELFSTDFLTLNFGLICQTPEMAGLPTKKERKSRPLYRGQEFRGVFDQSRGYSNRNTVSTMHVCLSIPEILAIVCTEVAPDVDLDSREKQDLASLAALARTSHIFSESALNALWSGLADIVPLLQCMPSDLWEERKLAGRKELVRPDVSRTYYES
jgi:hypothetical protein